MHGAPAGGGDHDRVLAARQGGFEELIAVVDRDADDSVGARTAKGFQRRLLDLALAGGHQHEVRVQEVLVLELFFGDVEDGPDAILRIDLNVVADRAAAGGAAPLRNLERPQPEALPVIGKEEEHIVGVADEQMLNVVVVALAAATHPDAAAALRPVGVDARALDEPLVSDRHDHVLALDQVFDDDIAAGFVDLGAAFVVELLLDGQQLVANNLHPQLAAVQNALVPLDFLDDVAVFAGDFLALQAGQPAQRKAKDGARLVFGEPVALLRAADQRLVFVVQKVLHRRLRCVGLHGRNEGHAELAQVVLGEL